MTKPFVKSAFALIPMIVFLWLRGVLSQSLATKRPIDHLTRANFGMLAMSSMSPFYRMLHCARMAAIEQPEDLARQQRRYVFS